MALPEDGFYIDGETFRDALLHEIYHSIQIDKQTDI